MAHNLYVPLDVDFATDDKILAAGPAAAYLYVCSLAYCKRTLNDGAIARNQLRAFSVGLPKAERHASTLVDVGLWVETETGWRVASWLKHNPAKAHVRAVADRKHQASLKANHERWHVDGKTGPDCPLCFPESVDDPCTDPSRIRSGGALGDPNTSQSQYKPEPEPKPEPETQPPAVADKPKRTRRPRAATVPSSPPAPRATDDPITASARTLTQVAFEQNPKPACSGGFSAVMGIIEHHLRAGQPCENIDRAIRNGVRVWTIAGLSMALVKTTSGSTWADRGLGWLDPANDSHEVLDVESWEDTP